MKCSKCTPRSIFLVLFLSVWTLGVCLLSFGLHKAQQKMLRAEMAIESYKVIAEVKSKAASERLQKLKECRESKEKQ